VTPEYFGVLGVKQLEGRLLDEHDAQADNLLSVVVDRAWAQRFFPDGRALGARFKEGGCTECPWTTVVGIVSDVKYVGLSRAGEGTVYWPMAGGESRFVVMKTEGDPRTAVPSVRRIVRAMDPDVPFTGTSTIDDLVAASLDSPRSLSLLVAGFAAVALVLSAVGIYGLMAFYVGQHTKEISIRLALGGAATDVLKLVVGHGLTIVAGGVLIGLITALATTRLIANLLFGVSAFDAFTFVAVAVFLFGIALLACVVPASRAIRVQPAEILRNE
jgi:putative ABC transport system permease protein